jgi:hypothetical protein
MSDVSVSKRKNGKWEVRWRDSSGRRRSRSVTFKRDADRFATEIRRQQQVGNLVDLERGLVLLADFVVEYWRDYAIPNLAPRTRDVYGRVWEKHVRPRIGGLPLRTARGTVRKISRPCRAAASAPPPRRRPSQPLTALPEDCR